MFWCDWCSKTSAKVTYCDTCFGSDPVDKEVASLEPIVAGEKGLDMDSIGGAIDALEEEGRYEDVRKYLRLMRDLMHGE